MAFLVFDIGGTKMRFAISEDGNHIDRQIKISTEEKYSDALEKIHAAVVELVGDATITSAAGGIAGTFDSSRSRLLRSPHLPGWVNTDVAVDFGKILTVVPLFNNDAAMVGLGEALVGAGKGYHSVSYITVSTGVGGARIIDGKIDRSVHGFEPGHQVIDADGNLCPECAKPGDLENYISGTAIEARFGKPPKEVADPEVWKQLADWLAYGLLNTAVHWSPDVIVLGGSMIVGDPAIDLIETDRKFKEIMSSFPEIPLIKKAALGDNGGLIGSLEYLKQQ